MLQSKSFFANCVVILLINNSMKRLLQTVLVSSFLAASSVTYAQSVAQPGDPVIASSANSPGSEGVANAIDGKPTKYLNFDGKDGNPSGFID